eukprot:3824214-Alexandrium_andersonii.AAC.1
MLGSLRLGPKAQHCLLHRRRWCNNSLGRCFRAFSPAIGRAGRYRATPAIDGSHAFGATPAIGGDKKPIVEDRSLLNGRAER